MSLTVTANAGGNAAPGILLRVLALDSATLPGTLNTVSQSGTGTHDASITPAYTGSKVLAAEINFPATAAAPGAATGNTALDAVSDIISNGSPGYGYGTFESTGTMTSGTPFTAGSSDTGTPGGVAVLEIEPSGTISTDASSPASVSSVSLSQGVTGVATAAFLPPAGALIAALVSAAGSPYGTVSMTVADSYGLVWTEAVRANALGNGYAGIWYAYAPAALAAPPVQTLPGANLGSYYSGSVSAANGYAPYTFTLASGSLPAGLALNPDGTIVGTPVTAATSTFTVLVTDAAGRTATSGTQTLTVSSPPPAAPYLSGHWQARGAPYYYGTTTVPVQVTEHDWIFAVAAWTQTYDTAVNAANGYITDDAHNVYQPVAVATGATGQIAIWAVPNARAVSRVYVSTDAFVRNVQVTVLAVRNLQPGFVVDVTAPAASDSSSSGWTQSLTTTQPDFVLAAGVIAGSGVSLTLPSAWSPVPNSNTGTVPASSVTGWQSAPSPGALSAAFTISGTSSPVPYTGAMVAVYAQQPGIISNPDNPAWPDIKVQAAFGYTPGTPVGLPDWTDISGRFLGLSGTRGRTFELDELSAADMTLELDNSDGALSPGGSYGADLITPVQVLATWQGRTYPLFSGIITAIPQTYDFQYEIVKTAVSDDYSKLPQILLPSCMIAELVYDNPLHLWPLNEPTGATMASNWSGRSTAILVPVNSKYGGGVTNQTPVTGFGSSSSANSTAVNPSYPAALEGSTDTVWADCGAQIGGGIYVKGTALSCRGSTALPLTGTGAVYEVWTQIWNNTNNLSSGAVIMVLSDDKGTGAGGCFFRVLAKNTGTVAAPKTAFYVVQEGLSWSGAHSFTTENLFDNNWHHYAIQVFTDGTVTVYIDGTAIGSFTAAFPSGVIPTRLQFGGDVTVNPNWSGSAGGGFLTGLMCNAVVYDHNIDPERILSHYQSGATGFARELSGQRIQRVLSYAHWAAPQAIEPGVSHMQVFNYLGGGYGSSGLSGAIGAAAGVGYTSGGGFTADGAQADVTIQDIASSEVGFLLVGADGTLGFRERSSTLDVTSSGSMGDMDYALNQTTTFANGLGTWGTVTSGTLGLTTSWGMAAHQAAVFTVTGTPASAGVQSELMPVAPAGGSFWGMSPTGCYVHVQVNYYDSTRTLIHSNSAGDAYLPPMTPGIVTTSAPFQGAQIPVNAVYMSFGPVLDNSPATGTQLYFDHIRLSPAGFQVPYEGDVEITEDIQYLYNYIMVTRNIDQVRWMAQSQPSVARYYPRVFTRTVYTDPSDTEAVVDCANWLLSSFASPQPRVSNVVIDAASNPEAWEFALSIDIGDLVYFTRNPVQGAPVSGTFIVLSVEPDIAENRAKFTYVLAPATGLYTLTLDDPVYGLIGNCQLVW